MGTAYSRNQVSIDRDFNPADVGHWDLYHVQLLHNAFLKGDCGFGIPRWQFTALLTEALPAAKGKAQQLWSTYADGEEDCMYPVELWVCLLFQCRGQSRDKACFLFDLAALTSDCVTHDELCLFFTLLTRAIAAVTADNAAPLRSRPPSPLRAPTALDTKALAAAALASAGRGARGAGAALSRDDFLQWVSAADGLGIALDADVELEALAAALGVGGGIKWRPTREWHEE